MEIVIVIVILYFLFFAGSRSRWWNPFRGAPDVKSAVDANAVSDRRMDLLRSVGQNSNALPVSFGLLRIPLEVLSKPTILFGLPGTGKTSLINIALKSLIPLFDLNACWTRFVFLDVKNELPRRLHALMPANVAIHYLNPLDARSSVLDFPNIFATRSDIDQLAYTICPAVSGDQTPYFRNAARQIIALVVAVLQKNRKSATHSWGLFELCAIVSDKRLLRRVMFCDYEARSFYTSTLGPKNKAAGDVFSTLRSVIQPLIPAALVELESPARLNLKDFLREDGVAVLGIPPTGSQSVLPLFNVSIRRLIEEAQVCCNSPEDRLFLVLDEVAMLDRAVVEAIVNATCLGRSHNIHVIAATQSLELLEAKFGADQAHAYLASCATTVAFRCASKKTAEYVVGRMGNQEGIVLLTSWSQSSGPGGGSSSTTTTQHLQTRATVLADEVLHAPLADPVADTMTFWTVCPTIGNAVVTTPFIEETTVQTDPNYPNLSPRNPSGHGLRALTKSDWVALGLPRNRRTNNGSTP
jgi:hypothetical protein